MVPSPATVEVLEATSLTSWAPKVFKRVFEARFPLGDGDAVLGDGRAAEGFFDHDVAARGAKRDLDGLGEDFDALANGRSRASVLVIRSFLRPWDVLRIVKRLEVRS